MTQLICIGGDRDGLVLNDVLESAALHVPKPYDGSGPTIVETYVRTAEVQDGKNVFLYDPGWSERRLACA